MEYQLTGTRYLILYINQHTDQLCSYEDRNSVSRYVIWQLNNIRRSVNHHSNFVCIPNLKLEMCFQCILDTYNYENIQKQKIKELAVLTTINHKILSSKQI